MTPIDAPLVYIVDDDQAMLRSLQRLVEAHGYRARCFESAEGFLATLDPSQPGCLLLDVRMPGMSGLELQARLKELGCTMPVIIVTGHGDIPMAVEAIRAGALEFLEKPFGPDRLIRCVEQALAEDARRRRADNEAQQTRRRLALLSKRENQVLRLILSGRLNKQIASDLSISQKTVENHRAHIMTKMGAENAADLARRTCRLVDVPAPLH